MVNQVRWAVLGAAKIARQTVCPALHLSARGKLAAVASRDINKARALAAPYGDITCYDTYDAVLDDPSIDAVYIPLPNNDHVAWTLKCLEAGKHVLCEKPIALQAAQIDALISTRNDTGLLAAEAVMAVHHPQWLRLRDLLADGAIGRLRQVQGAFSYNNVADPGNIRNFSQHGGGALRDIGIYPCVTTRFATGQEPVAMRSAIDWENGVDISARVWADFPDFHLEFYCSMRMGLRQQMVFHGEDGFITLHAPFNAASYGQADLEIRTSNTRSVVESFPIDNQYVHQFDNFHASILDGADYPCSLEFSKQTQQMIDRIFEAEN